MKTPSLGVIFSSFSDFILFFKGNPVRRYVLVPVFFLGGIAMFTLLQAGMDIFYTGLGEALWENMAAANVISLGVVSHMRVLEQENRSLRYKTLQDRVLPHFLFNSLSSAIAIVQSGNHHKAEEILTDLSELYRYITYESFQESVSLSKEIEFCEKYFSVMKVRFDDMIQCRFFIKGEIDNIEVAPFSIQPLLENAIKHGFDGEKPMQIDVKVYASARKGTLILVENDGLPLKEDVAFSETMSNITERLRMLHDKVDIKIENREDQGVAVSLFFAPQNIIKKVSFSHPGVIK